MLGNYVYARTAYARARTFAPENPWYAHNLGHLLDIALGKPEEACAHLKYALDCLPRNADLALSYAHALACAGDVETAHAVLGPHGSLGHNVVPMHAWFGNGTDDADRSARPLQPKAKPRAVRKTVRVVEQGLRNLPLSASDRDRVRMIFRGSRAHVKGTSTSVLAASAVWRFVNHTDFPLSIADVAATFRVPVRSVRDTANALNVFFGPKLETAR
jgi:hypothetical protein